MTLHTALISLLLLQAAPAARSQAPKATVAGVVLNANGEPLPNIRVALGRTDVPLGLFAQMVAGERPPVETTIPAEALAAMVDEIAALVQSGLADPQLAVQAAAYKSIPIADIHELIAGPSGGLVVVPKSAPPMLTDERGRFSFNDVEPGTYKVMFSGNGYARQDYGQRTSAGGVPMTLAPGQAKTDIVMRMMAVAALSGRIRDALGQPVAGVTVQLFRFIYDETGQRKIQRVTGTRTDDRGEYRMYYLSPGRYYMSAGNQPGENQQNIGVPSGLEALLFGPGYSSPNRVAQNYTLMYYPGVPDENSATPIEVQSGADVRGIDVFVNPQRSYRVRGLVVDSRTGQPPPNAFVRVNVQNPDPTNPAIGLFRGNSNYIAADGTFEVQDVSAGAYTVSASLPSPAQTRPPDIDSMSPAERNAFFQSQQELQNAVPKGSATVNVVNADVEGVVLTLGVSISLAGRFRAESNALAADALGFMRVQMKGGSVPVDPLTGGGPQPRPITADGTFRIDNLWPGEYHVSVAGLPPGFYLKEARFADTDVLNGPLRLNGPDSQLLDLLISSNVGSIDGVAVDATGQPMAGAQVVLIPGRSRERAELFRPVSADLNGRFTISSIAPGEYILAAWEAMEPNAYFDPNSIRQAEGSGKAVRVSESSSQTLNVSVIPLAAR